jgi:hypothetical protein
MAQEKKKMPRMTSPKGIAKFPALSVPDTKFKKDGEFHVELLLDENDQANIKFVEGLRKLAEEAFQGFKAGLKKTAADKVRLHLPFKQDLNKEDEPTGYVAIPFKTAAQYIDKKTQETIQKSVPLFDAKGKAITSKPNVGGGSVIKVSFVPFEFYNASADKAGVSLRLQAVQILELKSYGSTAADHGFGQEEGGYDSSESEGGTDAGEGEGDF